MLFSCYKFHTAQTAAKKAPAGAFQLKCVKPAAVRWNRNVPFFIQKLCKYKKKVH